MVSIKLQQNPATILPITPSAEYLVIKATAQTRNDSSNHSSVGTDSEPPPIRRFFNRRCIGMNVSSQSLPLPPTTAKPVREC